MPATVHATINLSDLSDTAFQEIVNADVRGTLDSETSKLLRLPEHAARWHDTLLIMKRSVEAQLTAKKGELASQHAEYLSLGGNGKTLWIQAYASAEKWRQGAIRFKNGVEEKVAEAKRLLSTEARDLYVKQLVDERNQAMKEAFRLRAAISDHRQAVTLADDTDTEEIDDRLWSVLE